MVGVSFPSRKERLLEASVVVFFHPFGKCLWVGIKIELGLEKFFVNFWRGRYCNVATSRNSFLVPVVERHNGNFAHHLIIVSHDRNLIVNPQFL